MRPDGAVLRAGVVGLGRQALRDHVPALLESDSADLVAVCDRDADVLREQRTRLDVPGYADVEAMFGGERLDFVVVCVPHDAGRRVIECAAAHKVHVLKEKPFAVSLDEAEVLMSAVERAGIHLMVTVQRRFDPIYDSFARLAERIGTPFAVEATHTLCVDDPSEGWRGRLALAGGGCVIDMGYHLADILLRHFGLPDRVIADMSAAARPDRRYDAEDTALLHFSYDTGLYGSLLLSRCIGPKSEHIRLVGSRGIVYLERGRIRRLTRRGDVVESLVHHRAHPSTALDQIDHFCGVLHGTRTPVPGPRENLTLHRFIQSCYESARLRASVDPKELT